MQLACKTMELKIENEQQQQQKNNDIKYCARSKSIGATERMTHRAKENPDS